ncbi:hypothetical protein [Amycolatopsis sp. NPDC021455]|uniref:hypothetical protein n=1 Tax=Amycolatopsis sp. NPDC021455 TaxID=3154901 RepID=UPI0033CA5E56
MPTAIEYAVAQHWHAQNGCGGGPPEANLVLAHSGTSPDVSVAQADGWLLGGLPAVLLLAVAAAVWSRRAARALSGAADRNTRGGV